MKKESDIDKLDPKRLIAVREGLGLNKSAAAKLLEITPMAYGRYEAGQRSPSIQTIDVIAQRFGTSRAYLCGESDDTPFAAKRRLHLSELGEVAKWLPLFWKTSVSSGDRFGCH